MLLGNGYTMNSSISVHLTGAQTTLLPSKELNEPLLLNIVTGHGYQQAHVLFSDDRRLILSHSEKRHKVRMWRGERYLPDCLQEAIPNEGGPIRCEQGSQPTTRAPSTTS